MIAIVDYGAGNLNSVKKAFDYLGAENVVTNQPERCVRGRKDRIARSRTFFLALLSALFRVARIDAQGALRGHADPRNLPWNAMAFRRQ